MAAEVKGMAGKGRKGMTVKAQETYERMLEVAKRDALEVRGHGTRKSDGAAVYCVPSRSEATRWHLVRVNGLSLTCDCHAAHYNRYCGGQVCVPSLAWIANVLGYRAARDLFECAQIVGGGAAVDLERDALPFAVVGHRLRARRGARRVLPGGQPP